MYRFKDNQLRMTEFGAAEGLKLKPENRWTKKARCIHWEGIELRYAKLFTNRKGNLTKPLRLALGACIIQAKYGYSDEEIALQIQEGAYNTSVVIENTMTASLRSIHHRWCISGNV